MTRWHGMGEELAGSIRLAFPVAVVQVGMMAMGVADTIMVGHVSAADLAAVSLGHLYFFTAVVFGMGVLMALDPVVAQAVGADDRVAIARGIQRGGLLSFALALAAVLVLLPAEGVLTLLRQPPEVVPLAAGYALATAPGVLPFYLFIVLRQSLQAMGRVKRIVAVVAAANVANLAFNWTLVYGNLGAPAMGAVGAGWASTLSRWFMAAGLLALSWPLLSAYLRPIRSDVLRLRPLGRMVRLGAPIGIQFSLEFGAFGAVGILMGWLGAVAMAGHQVAINLASFTFMVPVGIAQASAVLVGRAIGRDDPDGARRAAAAGLLLGGGFMIVTAAVFLLFPGPLAAVYSGDPRVRALAASLLPIAGLFQVFDGLQVVAGGVLRGTGDTRSPMVVNLLGFWLVGIPVSVFLGFRTGAGPVGLWWGLASGLGAVAVILLWRVRRRMGGQLRRLVLDER